MSIETPVKQAVERPGAASPERRLSRRKLALQRTCARGDTAPQAGAHPNPPRRRDGAWKRAFLAALESTGNVTAACGSAGISRAAYYKERENNSEFRRQCRDALASAADMLEFEARRRAVDGWLEPVFHKGEVIGHIHRYSDGLLIRLLAAHLPKRFGRGNVREAKPAKQQTAGPPSQALYADIIAKVRARAAQGSSNLAGS